MLDAIKASEGLTDGIAGASVRDESEPAEVGELRSDP